MAPVVEENLPAAQLVQLDDPAVAHLPAGHVPHAVADVAPVLPEAVPASQRTQGAPPGPHFPAPHTRQLFEDDVPSLVVERPVGHARHEASVTPPLVSEKRPMPHNVQEEDPAPAYRPAAQMKQ